MDGKMSGKIKALLVVLALGALVSASRFLAIFSANPGQQTATQALALKSQLDDDDHDGLSNRDEAYWTTNPQKADSDGDGFLDGEEVLSGHDPRKKGPNDYLDPGKNLTQRTVDLALGGMIAGDLKPDSPKYQESVKLLADAMSQQFKRNATVVLDPMTIVEDSVETKTAYFKAMSTALVQIILPATKDTQKFLDSVKDVSVGDTSALTDDAKRYQTFTATTHRLATSMGDRAVRLAAIAVPKSFTAQNRSAIQMLRAMQKYFELLGHLKEDPFQGSIVLSSLIRLEYETVPRFMYDFTQALSLKLK